jgi:hypothetical protein
MHIGRCPACHAHLDLSTLVQDEAARELLALLAGLEAELGRALVQYLGLFKPAKQDLRWDRALRLSREALDMSPYPMVLARSLEDTVDGIRSKGGALPIRDHAYLRKVVAARDTTAAAIQSPARAEAAPRAPSSRTSAAMLALAGRLPDEE